MSTPYRHIGVLTYYISVVEYDLRSPSMLRGKKGFDRLAYACKNVLDEPTTWLFLNLSKSRTPPHEVGES